MIELRHAPAVEAHLDRYDVTADAEPHRLNAEREAEKGREEHELVHVLASCACAARPSVAVRSRAAADPAPRINIQSAIHSSPVSGRSATLLTAFAYSGAKSQVRLAATYARQLKIRRMPRMRGRKPERMTRRPNGR